METTTASRDERRPRPWSLREKILGRAYRGRAWWSQGERALARLPNRRAALELLAAEREAWRCAASGLFGPDAQRTATAYDGPRGSVYVAEMDTRPGYGHVFWIDLLDEIGGGVR